MPWTYWMYMDPILTPPMNSTKFCGRSLFWNNPNHKYDVIIKRRYRKNIFQWEEKSIECCIKTATGDYRMICKNYSKNRGRPHEFFHQGGRGKFVGALDRGHGGDKYRVKYKATDINHFLMPALKEPKSTFLKSGASAPYNPPTLRLHMLLI